MSRQKDAQLAVQAARAIDRVLLAERQADADLAQARLQAEQELERAREDALARVNRAMDRIASWQQAHTQAMQRRLALLRAKADADAVNLRALEEPALESAVQVVASRLCGGAGDAVPVDRPAGRHG
jgi:vacuolar-type H+-ATPase subunit H